MGDKTSLGISQNLEGVLCYLAGFLTGIIFLLIEKENQFVRFHAMQSLLVFGGLAILYNLVVFIPLIGGLLFIILGPAGLLLWIFLMYKAFTGEKYMLPTIGEIAENQLK